MSLEVFQGRRRPWQRAKALLLTPFLLASCAKPPALKPPQQIPDHPRQWMSDQGVSGTVLGNWWTTFGDPSLNELVAEALRRSHDLKAAAYRVDAALAQSRLAGAGLLPSAEAAGGGSRRRQNFIGFPIPGSERRTLSTTSTNLGVSLNVSWEADLWGRLKDSARASLAEAEATRSDLGAARHSLAAQIAKAWFSLAEARQQLDLTQRTLQSYQESADRIERRYRLGLQPPLDLRLALSNVKATAALLSLRQDGLQRSIRQLETLLGRYPEGVLDAPRDLPPLPALPAAGIPGQLLSRRPDLVSAEWRLVAADSRLSEARKAFYPRVVFSAGSGTLSANLKDVLDPDLFVWNLIGNLTQPVFQGGSLKAGAELNEARLRRAGEEFASALLQAFLEVETALESERFLGRRENDLGETLEQSQAALRLAEDQYRSGLQSYVTVLEAQRRALAGEVELIAVRHQRLLNRIDLHLALGGAVESPDAGGAPPNGSQSESADAGSKSPDGFIR